MKKWFTLLGFVLLVVTVTLCSLSASAKEKTDLKVKSEYLTNVYHFEVSCETFVHQSVDLPERLPWNSLGLITDNSYFIKGGFYNDPYLVRSKRWIRERNLKASSITYRKPTETLQVNLSQKINC